MKKFFILFKEKKSLPIGFNNTKDKLGVKNAKIFVPFYSFVSGASF